MMRKYSRLGYLLLLAILLAGITVSDRDFGVATLFLGIVGAHLIYRALRRGRRLRGLLPSGLPLAVALASFYYVAGLVVFPHAHGAHRLHDAIGVGLISSFGGFTIRWMQNVQPLPLSEGASQVKYR